MNNLGRPSYRGRFALSWTMSALSAALAVMLVLVPCVAQSQASVAESSDSLELAVGHAYMGADVTRASRGTLIREVRRATWKGDGSMSVSRSVVRPTPKEWEEFWARMDSLGVWNWAPQYSDSARSSLPDGTGWGLTLRHARRTLASRGYNAMPAKFYEVDALVQRLVKQASPGHSAALDHSGARAK